MKLSRPTPVESASYARHHSNSRSSAELSLTVAISVLGENLRNWDVGKLPVVANVSYSLIIQGAGEGLRAHAESNLVRNDLELVFLPTIGVTKSRNAAIRETSTDILLFADDDTDLIVDGYPELLKRFSQNPKLAFFLCRLKDDAGNVFKKYRSDMTPVNRLNCGRTGTPEIAIRPQRFRDVGVYFDESFGAGSSVPLGDEYIFLCDALAEGLVGVHADTYLAIHYGASSGNRLVAGSSELREMVLRRAIGRWSWPYRCIYAFKHIEIFSSLSDIFRFLKF